MWPEFLIWQAASARSGGIFWHFLTSLTPMKCPSLSCCICGDDAVAAPALYFGAGPSVWHLNPLERYRNQSFEGSHETLMLEIAHHNLDDTIHLPPAARS